MPFGRSIIVGIGLLVLGAAPAAATAVRTFVSGKGLDSNACSLVAPCRTFAGALAQTSANGEIVVLDSAGYGAVTIDKPVTISDQTGVEGAVTVVSGAAVTVQLTTAGTVTLKGLTLDGGKQPSTTGIRSVDPVPGTVVNVVQCTIRNFQVGIEFHVFSGSAKLFVLDTLVMGNGTLGIYLQNSSLTRTLDAKIQNSFLEQNAYGLGVYADQGPLNATVTNTDVSNNFGGGTDIEGLNFVVTFEHSTLETNNGKDVDVATGAEGLVNLFNRNVVTNVNAPAGVGYTDGTNDIVAISHPPLAPYPD